jgi:predicted transcriptional regulator
MNNLPLNHHFIKSFKNLLKGKLTAREVLIYGIILSFKNTPKGCFISRAEFAERINESEATAERAVQLLISEGYVKAYRHGRKRYLVLTDLYQVDTNETNEPEDLYQVNTDESDDLYQN